MDREILRYSAPWSVFSMDWSSKADRPFRIAVGSFIEEYRNKVQIIQPDQAGELKATHEFDHGYPATRVRWSLDANGPDLLATTGDFLRIWEVADDGVQRRAVLNPNKNSEFAAPQTALDWNSVNPNIIGTSSVDTTCTIWDITKGQVLNQLIAHDKEVYDFCFKPGSPDIFVSAGADGSVRRFDLNDLEQSTILYESPDGSPLVRAAWNKQDPHYIAVVQLDSPKIAILDTRNSGNAVAELIGHTGSVNAACWAPHSSGHICTAADDSRTFVWDMTQVRQSQLVQQDMTNCYRIHEPILCYNAPSEINQLAWSSVQTDWIAIASGDVVECLRV